MLLPTPLQGRVKVGTQVLCADGSITLEVKSVGDGEIVTEVLNSAKLGESKSFCRWFDSL